LVESSLMSDMLEYLGCLFDLISLVSLRSNTSFDLGLFYVSPIDAAANIFTSV